MLLNFGLSKCSFISSLLCVIIFSLGVEGLHSDDYQPPDTPFLDDEGRVTTSWSRFLNQNVIDSCQGVYQNGIPTNSLTKHTTGQASLHIVAQNDFRRWRDYSYQDWKDVPVVDVTDDVFNRYRPEFFFGTLCVLFTIAFVICLFAACCPKGMRACWSAICCKLCCGFKERAFRSRKKTILYALLFSVVFLLLPVIFVSLMGYYGIGAMEGVEIVQCEAHRLPHSFAMGVSYDQDKVNPYQISIPTTWGGYGSAWRELAYFQSRFSKDDGSIHSSMISMTADVRAKVIRTLEKADQDLSNLVDSMRATGASFREGGVAAAKRHTCTVCNEFNKDETQTTVSDMRESLTKYRKDVIAKLDEIDSKAETMVTDMKDALKTIDTAKAKLENTGDSLRSYYQSLHDYETYADLPSRIARISVGAIIVLICLIIIVAAIVGFFMLREDVPLAPRPALRRCVAGLWICSGCYAVWLLFFGSVFLLIAGFANQPCVVLQRDLVRDGRFEDYALVDELFDKGANRTDTYAALREFATAGGGGDLMSLEFAQRGRKDFDTDTDKLRKEVLKAIEDSIAGIPQASLLKTHNQLIDGLKVFHIDFESYDTDDDKEELWTFEEIVVSAVQKDDEKVPDDITIPSVPAGENIPVIDDVTVIYGMDAVQSRINQFLSDEGISAGYRNWCIKVYGNECDSGNHGYVIAFPTTPDLDDIMRGIRAELDGRLAAEEVEIRFTRFENAVEWAQRKVDLLHMEPIVIARAGEARNNFSIVEGTKELTKLIKSATIAIKPQLEDDTDQVAPDFDEIIASVNKDIDRGADQTMSAKSALADAMISSDSVCYGVLNSFSNFTIFILTLGFLYMLGMVIAYCFWFYYLDLEEMDRRKVVEDVQLDFIAADKRGSREVQVELGSQEW